MTFNRKARATNGLKQHITLGLAAKVSTEDLEGGAQTLPYLIASVKVAVAFIRTVVGAIPALQQLLASGTITDTNEAINVIIELYSFRVRRD